MICIPMRDSSIFYVQRCSFICPSLLSLRLLLSLSTLWHTKSLTGPSVTVFECSSMSLEESKTQIRTAIYQRWTENHPNYSKTDAYHRLNREGQTIIFRLRSGHNRLNTCIQNSKLAQAPTAHVAISLKQLSTSSRIAHFMQN